MKQNFVVKYISIIVILASFMGSFHHHNDLKQHNDCQICTIQHNVTDIDTPADVSYLTLFTIVLEATLASLPNFQIEKQNLTFSARAPPSFS